jgi:hypothetical protein
VSHLWGALYWQRLPELQLSFFSLLPLPIMTKTRDEGAGFTEYLPFSPASDLEIKFSFRLVKFCNFLYKELFSSASSELFIQLPFI